jgi:aquaporin Z
MISQNRSVVALSVAVVSVRLTGAERGPREQILWLEHRPLQEVRETSRKCYLDGDKMRVPIGHAVRIHKKTGVPMSLPKRCTAEVLGTFWLVFGGCGSAVLAAAFPHVGIGLLGVAFAFGLTVLTMAFAIGHISGCHLNPAVTVGLAVGRRFEWKEVPPYVIAQVLGAVIASSVLYVIASGAPGFSLSGGFAANGYGEHSPGSYSLTSAIVAEMVLTFIFLMIIQGATDRRAPAGFAPIAIGLALTLIHLIGIPVTNLSVNPARSTGPAVFVGGWALQQLWMFWIVPIAGAALAGIVYPAVFSEESPETVVRAKAATR